MSDGQWEDYYPKADYSCDPYTYYFLWSNFGKRDYEPHQPPSSSSYSRLNWIVGLLILLLLSVVGI
ncbi:hypothetical protein [Gloeothece verrucosa]|uniref:Uncharacterized protein n=1 Tax=Gloeothece verrucosa (strain PCC 7822) TaxID=497965 RepID=E0UHA8_GLOV7|nr:hypothetical protein [Gloeothece verrucosa]ADN16822.1 hypothetical protein Cyan7822_4931 [Gloeothece verrucosa PCC 7822]